MCGVEWDIFLQLMGRLMYVWWYKLKTVVHESIEYDWRAWRGNEGAALTVVHLIPYFYEDSPFFRRNVKREMG